jgi:hypothetical protein
MHRMRLSLQQKSDCISMRVASNTVASCNFSGEIAEYERWENLPYTALIGSPAIQWAERIMWNTDSPSR